jgi:hypothetical protein
MEAIQNLAPTNRTPRPLLIWLFPLSGPVFARVQYGLARFICQMNVESSKVNLEAILPRFAGGGCI